MSSSIPSPVDTETNPAELFHSRLADGPDWLAGLLRHKDPGRLSEAERIYLRTKIDEYCDGAASTEDQRIVVDHALREVLVQQFDDWCHSVTRLKYQQYLHSDGWERTRLKVLERAGYVCEACGERRATQVHHVTYEDPRGEEVLWNLKAVCDECHEKITARQKGKPDV